VAVPLHHRRRHHRTRFIHPRIWLRISSGFIWFLSQEEREYVVERIWIDNESYIQDSYCSMGVEREHLTKGDALETAKT